jgi:glycyl-tRNA synthetase
MSTSLEKVTAWAKRKGFVYPNSEIYGGLANARDYGPYGSLLKKNIADAWWKFFVQERDDVLGMDTAIIAHPQTWVASGHAGNF